ncbi:MULTISPECIES: PepSY domain-containing protein [Microbulbifer]|uniref:PepSY domain-containing protein n=1 Tax=Microbulbifer celer TaxID=435905 RepID=A0ABW3UAC8_9GAMM|nr:MULTISPECIES: PepSY domain-containing protein [Microbulbifer]UFN57590.1 PepSY domain-containing protein [Microbulbifer celer]
MNLRKQWLQWHNRLGWYALAGILVWAISGISHPMMAWFGPSAAKFFPPSMTLSQGAVGRLPDLLADPAITADARVIKLVPSAQGALLQITRNERDARSYYRLDEHPGSTAPVTDGDLQQARWLAAYYSGRPTEEIADIQLQTRFDNAYPSVNRLLPVYRVRFAGDDRLTLFVHTETAALASMTDASKTLLQGVFRQLHTFAWLDELEYGRLMLIGLLMLTLAVFATTGLALVFALKSRKITDGKRRYHRWLGYALWLPLLGWSASGFYHLLQSSLVEPVEGLRLGETVVSVELSGDFTWLSELDGRAFNSVSLIAGDGGEPLYRIGLAPEAGTAPGSRNQRFDGRPSEGGALFVNARTGRLLQDYSDRQQAQLLAGRFAGAAVTITDTELVTRYGPDYDFRNKRLPVWRVTVDDGRGTMLFVDPVTGVLVDQSRRIDRSERLSFSLLHKWSHLTPFTGRQVRDVMIVATLMLLLTISALGAILLLGRNKRRRRTAVPGAPVASPVQTPDSAPQPAPANS